MALQQAAEQRGQPENEEEREQRGGRLGNNKIELMLGGSEHT